ncbi:hypothetical protein OHR86_00215 [Streptomyces sp. NBC_00441]|uniref:hypothetical protein n=1 Tax=Streptomyces sp. NBC_00441 TaxID=2975742 RepID=UPI002E28DD6C|nr:hypothetical protein [Streptomyces sp. NBC_00441]
MTTALPLPDPATLSDAQQRGAACVWCTAPLTNTNARDLGARPLLDPDFSSAVRWYPRCCPTTCRKDRA